MDAEVNKEKNGIKTDDNLVRYWIYSPGQNASKWDECQKDNLMMILKI